MKPQQESGNDSRSAPRSLEELMAAPTVEPPSTLLSEELGDIADIADLLREGGRERQAFGEELARRVTAPLDELADDLLREGGA